MTPLKGNFARYACPACGEEYYHSDDICSKCDVGVVPAYKSVWWLADNLRKISYPVTFNTVAMWAGCSAEELMKWAKLFGFLGPHPPSREKPKPKQQKKRCKRCRELRPLDQFSTKHICIFCDARRQPKHVSDYRPRPAPKQKTTSATIIITQCHKCGALQPPEETMYYVHYLDKWFCKTCYGNYMKSVGKNQKQMKPKKPVNLVKRSRADSIAWAWSAWNAMEKKHLPKIRKGRSVGYISRRKPKKPTAEDAYEHFKAHRECYLRKAKKLEAGEIVDPKCKHILER